MTENKPSILVTGGAGYIGSVLVGRLLVDGWRVRVLDNLTYSAVAILPFMGLPGFELIVGDIRNSADVKRALQGVQAVVHLAAIVGDPACARQPGLAVEVNRDGSELLLQQALESGVERFLFASTCSNYGVMSEKDGYVGEDSPLMPVSLYAETKVGFEQLLLSANRPGFCATCLRFATAYGLSGRPRFDLTVNEFTRDLVLGKQLEVYGQNYWRPYCHTTDLARAMQMVLAADEELVANQAFNIGATPENYTKKMLVDLILERLPEAKTLVSYVDHGTDVRNYRVSFKKIEDRPGFKITHTVPEGIVEIIDAIRSGMIDDPESERYGGAIGQV